MRLRHPKSFFTLLSAGFLLAVLPLAAGLLASTVAIQRLAEQSRQAVYDAARIAHATRELAEAATALERSARQLAVLNDAEFIRAYRDQQVRFVMAGTQLDQLPLDREMRAETELLLEQANVIHTRLVASAPGSPAMAEAARNYSKVFTSARQLLDHSNEVIDREADALRHKADEAEARARLQLAVVLPVAILVAAGFTYLLARPIGQLEQGIRGLGEGRFGEKIEVDGPADLEALGRKLDWLRLRLVQLEEQKSSFLRQVSHELKTPLTALREGSELLAEGVAGPLAPRQQEIVHIVRDNSLHLQRLVEDLLRHGEAEFRQAPLHLQRVRPREVMAAVADKQRLAMEARGLSLMMDVGDTLSFETDAERLRVVLDNLLSNAIKYSPQGGVITFAVRVEGDRVMLRLTDQGPGIAPEERERVFEAFYLGSAAAAGAVKGTGLGLSICREQVSSLGGHIEAGMGCGDFTVTLPRGGA